MSPAASLPRHRSSLPLAAGLNRQWEQLLADRMLEVSGIEPAPARQVLVRMSGAPAGAQRDRLWLALLADDAVPDSLGRRIVLQAMLGKAVRNARTLRGLYVFDDPAEREAVAVAAMWSEIQTYPVTRLPRKVTGNLSLNAIKRLHRAYPPAAVGREVCVEDPHHGIQMHPEPVRAEQELHDLLALLEWARDNAVLTDEQIRLLGSYTVAADHEQAQMAQQLGVKRESLTRRICLIRRTLREAVAVWGLQREALAP